MRRFALYALAAVLLGATMPGVPWFSPGQALRALVRDDSTVQGCMQQDGKSLRAGLSIEAISSKRRLALIQMHDACVCGNVNCPFWVYRVDGSAAKQLLAGTTIGLKTVARASGFPDIVTLAHDSALVSNGMRFAYLNGKYVGVDSWRLNQETNERKPASIEIKFAPGTSSARLSGTISTGWDDVYTFAASAGQRLSISRVMPQNGLDVELFPQPDGTPPVRADPTGKALALPATGTYMLTVDAVGSTADLRYVLTLTIR